MPGKSIVRDTKSYVDETEQLRVKCSHAEVMFGMGIVAVMVIGGLGCMAAGIAGGKEIVLAVLGFLAGYGIRRRNTGGTAPNRVQHIVSDPK
jgi:hypothetical protein